MKSVLITGTSSGFGLLTTVELAKQGWQVFATMRDLERRGALDSALSDVGASAQVHVIQLDVTDQSSIEAATRTVLETTNNTLDALVLNAGIAVAATFEDLGDEKAREIMETNFFGALAVTRAFLPAMRRQRKGRVVVVSSVSSYAGEPLNSIYCASKFALEGWAESLAFEVEPFGLDIILVQPGAYKTKIISDVEFLRPEGTAYGPFIDQVKKAGKGHLEAVARDPQEVATVIARALNARKPKFRYPVGPEAIAAWAMRGKISTRLARIGVSRYLGLHKIKL
jgi:NAD(P)-dependent dehydrogenase (short-subunit alcohol dehydrogenase family)